MECSCMFNKFKTEQSLVVYQITYRNYEFLYDKKYVSL